MSPSQLLAYPLVPTSWPKTSDQSGLGRILTWVGSKRVIAFYQPDNGNCAVHVVVWDPADVKAELTAGFQATLNPRQMAHINTAENKSLYLQCGDNAERLSIVDTAKFVVAGAAK